MAMAYGQAITQGPNGQMYTDRSMQTPYNPPPRNLENSDDLRRRQGIQPIQDMRARPPQRGIGSFPNPFGGFMGGGRGNFMQPQIPGYGIGFGGFGGFGMQPPMYGGGFGGFGMPPMYGGGMYGGGFGMQPPMFGGFGMQPPMYGGGFNPFSQNFYGGIGSMFPGMGGGYEMQRPPSYGGFDGDNYNFGPQPAQPIRPKPMPQPMPEVMPIMQTQGPDNIGGGRPSLQRVETTGPESLMRQDRIANYFTDRNLRSMQLQPF